MSGFTYTLLSNSIQVIVTRSQDRLTQYFTKGVMTYEYSASMIIFREGEIGDQIIANIPLIDIESPEFDINDPITLLYALGLETPPPDEVAYQNAPFSTGYKDTIYTLPTQKEEYLLYLFKGKVDVGGVVLRTVYETFISLGTEFTDHVIIRVAIGQTYDYTFLSTDYVDMNVNSYMSYTRPNVLGLPVIGAVPANVKVIQEGNVILQKNMKASDTLNEWMHIPVSLPSDGSLQYAITIIGLTPSAQISPSISWVEKNPI